MRMQSLACWFGFLLVHFCGSFCLLLLCHIVGKELGVMRFEIAGVQPQSTFSLVTILLSFWIVLVAFHQAWRYGK